MATSPRLPASHSSPLRNYLTQFSQGMGDVQLSSDATSSRQALEGSPYPAPSSVRLTLAAVVFQLDLRGQSASEADLWFGTSIQSRCGPSFHRFKSAAQSSAGSSCGRSRGTNRMLHEPIAQPVEDSPTWRGRKNNRLRFSLRNIL